MQMAELKITSGTIVTRGEDEKIEGEFGPISVTPALRFLLNLPETTETMSCGQLL
jgi:hypothetical protein